MPRLKIRTDGIKSVVHDIHPAVLGGEDEQGHESPAEVIKVVLLIDPAIVLVLQALHLVGDVLGHHVGPVTVEEESLEQLQIFCSVHARL